MSILTSLKAQFKKQDYFSKFFCFFFIFLSLLVFTYSFYRDFIFHNAELSSYYKKYYLVSLVVFLFSLASLYLKKIIKTYFFIIFLSITFTLYSYEGYLSSFDSTEDKISIYKKKTGKNFDLRSRGEIFKNLKKIHKNVAVPIPPQQHYQQIKDGNYKFKNFPDLFPVSGISNILTLNCNENGYFTEYYSDRYGFNNEDAEWNKEVIEFLLIGDSTTQGDCVHREDNIASNLIRLKQNDNGVLSLGYKANDTLIEYASLREYLPHINTKYVLWLYFEGNDLDGLSEEFGVKTFKKYYEDENFSQDLFFKQNEIDIKNRELMEKVHSTWEKEQNFVDIKDDKELEKFIKLYNLRKIIFSPYDFLQEQKAESINIFEKILIKSNNFSNKHDAKLIFVYLPSYNRYKQLSYDNNYKKVLDIIKNNQIPIIDVHDKLFKDHKDPLSLFPFRQRGHYNVEGFKLVSETIFNEIQIIKEQ